MKPSPTATGFRLIWRDPAVALAEIAWRWLFGLITTLVVVFSVFVFLGTIPVPTPAMWMMDTRRAALLGGTLAQIFHGSGWAATKLMLIGLPPLAMFWIVLASLGRTATIQPMLPESYHRGGWPRLLGVSFLRFATWFAANVALCGALILAAKATNGLKNPAATALLVFFAAAIIVLTAWSVLNWLLTLASIYVVRGEDTFDSISCTVGLLCRRFGPLMATSSAWGIVRAIALITATFLSLISVAFVRTIPPGYVLLVIVVISLTYLAFADFVYVGRLASYVAIIEADLEPPSTAPVVAEPSPSLDIVMLSPNAAAEN